MVLRCQGLEFQNEHLNPHGVSKHHFASLYRMTQFSIPSVFRTTIFMELLYYTIFSFITHFKQLHSQQIENGDSNSRLVVNADYNGKFRLERVNHRFICNYV